ncbi:MAG: glycosyltransferase family 9 protein [Verrucomicrobiota bacterium]
MKKLILRNLLSPGDIVMLTAAVRDLHECYPNQFVTDVRTSCTELWDYNPNITPLDENDPASEIIDCDYPLISRSNQAPYHCLHGFIDFLNDHLKLNIRPTAFKGDIHISDLEKSWYSQVREFAGEEIPFWIVVAGGKFDMTIKWWQTERYQQVVDHFRGRIQFVQVGERGHHHPKLNGVVDLRGKTDLRQLVRLVYHSQGVLCGVTGAMHLAAAVEVRDGKPPNRPCVVIAGGREPVHWEAYPHHQFIHTVGQLPCCALGGCWKARTVALGDGDERDQSDRLCVDVVGKLPRCMDMITSADVIRQIEKYFDGGVLRYLSPKQAKAAAKAVSATATNSFYTEPVKIRRVEQSAIKAILIQQATGAYIQMLNLSGEQHNAYAARHDLSFWAVRGSVQLDRPPVWDKVLLIHMMLAAGFELVVWLDADTLIVRPDVDLRRALPDGPPIGMCRNPLPWGTQPWHYNAGVIFVRNTKAARLFFDNVRNAGPVEHSWQEQAKMNELSQQYPDVVQSVDNKWNCTRGVNPTRDPVIRAWHGKGRKAVGLMKAAWAAYQRKNGKMPVEATRRTAC